MQSEGYRYTEEGASAYLSELGLQDWKIRAMRKHHLVMVADKLSRISELSRNSYYRGYVSNTVDAFFNRKRPSASFEKDYVLVPALSRQPFQSENDVCVEIDRLCSMMTDPEIDGPYHRMMRMPIWALPKDFEKLAELYRLVDDRATLESLLQYMGDTGPDFLFSSPFAKTDPSVIAQYFRNKVPMEWAAEDLANRHFREM